MKKIGISLALLFFLILFNKPAYGAACSLPASGNYTVSSPCDIAATNKTNGLDECNNNELSTTNTAILTVGADVAITTLAGSTIVTGSLVLEEGAVINLGTGAQIKIGTPLYMQDIDADGYLTSLTEFTTSTASGLRRRCLAKSLATIDCDSDSFSSNNSCFGHNNIAIANAGTTLTDYDIVFSLDTATPIGATAMTADCGDIRIKDSDNVTGLTYWIESGCNTANTQIWVRVPSIPNGSKTINLDYDGSTTTNGFESWAGNFTLLASAACPTGWTRNTSFDSKFPYGNATTYGNTGGTDSHTHDTWSGNTDAVNQGNKSCKGGTVGVTKGSHTHTVSVSHSTDTALPPYLTMVYCYNSNLQIKSGLISMYDPSVPTGWTRFSTLDGYFTYGGSSYSATPGGSATHTHTATTGATGATNTPCTSGTNLTGVSVTTHGAGAGNTTGEGSSLPAYYDLLFGQADSDSSTAQGGMITITSALPPLGWTQYSNLDNKFPRGASTVGGTGDGSHTHDVVAWTAQGNTRNVNAGSNAGRQTAHSHSVTYTTASTTNLPPYYTAIFAQRKTPSVTVTVE